MIEINLNEIPQLVSYLPLLDKGECAVFQRDDKHYEIRALDDDFKQLSTQSLAGAYSDDEPDYIDAPALETNPHFHPR